jgi:predicted aspartyl protease
MRFNGRWWLVDEADDRPMLRGEVLTKNGQWWDAEFLIDTGAERTVFSADVYRALGHESAATQERIAGVGGVISVPVVETQIRLTRDDGGKVVFRGRYAACAAAEALDMSVLGRYVLSLLAVIVDRPANIVCLLGGQHSYRIQGP